VQRARYQLAPPADWLLGRIQRTWRCVVPNEREMRPAQPHERSTGGCFMRRITLLLLWLLCALCASSSALLAGGARPAAAGNQVCFNETGYCAENAFLDFWQTHGQIAILGLPLSQAFVDDRGLIVQFYERAILEWHPENADPRYQVLLTRLGATQLGDRPEQLTPPAPCPDQNTCATFTETNHTLRGAFLAYWQAHGGLAVFGLPLTEEFLEVNPTDGNTYTVQYFERNRFELHPEAQPPYNVQLGLLGYEALRSQRDVLSRPAVPVPDYPQPAVGLPVRLSIPAINVDAPIEPVGVDASNNMATPQNPWDTAWYAPGPRPGQIGNAVIAGHVDYHDIGAVVFWNLHQLSPGAEIVVTADDGSRRRFVVTDVEIYPSDQAPLEQIFGATGDVNLNLVSCIGDFDPSTRSYNQRIVVYTRWDGSIQ
jgi:sortase (surface protein transpeptidase)